MFEPVTPETRFHSRYPTQHTHSIFELVENNKMYSVSMPAIISEATRLAIGHAIYLETSFMLNTHDEAPFGWMSLATKKDGLAYQGSFQKRLMNYLWKEHKVKLSPQLIGKMGNIIGKDASREDSSQHLMFDPYIMYKRGEFGDSDSCYWESRQGAKVLIRNNGGCFVEFFGNPNAYVDEDGEVVDGSGLGRCWLLPVNQFTSQKDAFAFALCNVYANTSDINKYNVARAVASVLGMSYKHASICSNSDTLWINGGCGFVLSNDVELLEKLSGNGISMSWGYHYEGITDPLQVGDEDEKYECQHCGELVTEDYYDFDHEVCRSCFDGMYICCEHCGDAFDREGDRIHLTDDGRWLCNYCLERKGYRPCNECGTYTKDFYDYLTEAEGGYYCDSCADDMFTICNECEEYVFDDDIHEYKGRQLCVDCYNQAVEKDKEDADGSTN